MRKKKTTHFRLKLIVAIMAICICATYFYSWKNVVMRQFVYPLQYEYLVRHYAAQEGVEPALVASVILVESKFDKEAASHRGAQGLMQIMPDTGEWIAKKMGVRSFHPAQLGDARINIRMGTWYLSYLMRVYKGNKVLALAAYNAGRGYVDLWIQNYGWTTDFSEIDKIPFAETREYVKIVLLNEQQYKLLYDF